MPESISRRLGISAFGRGCEHVIYYERQYALRPSGVVLLHRILRRSAGVAVRHTGAVLKGSIRVRITRGVYSNAGNAAWAALPEFCRHSYTKSGIALEPWMYGAQG
jgi:hypothetical protein